MDEESGGPFRLTVLMGGVLVGGTILFGLCWTLVPFLLDLSGGEGPFRLEERIAAASALFSALSFTALLVAILLQRRELQLQRQELSLTRGEVVRQANALEDQATLLKSQGQTLRRQAFENTFFQLLRQHHDIVQSQNVLAGGGNFQGRHAFNRAARDLVAELRKSSRDRDFQCTPHAIYSVFSMVCESAERDFSHYSRHLYYILLFIADSDVDDRRMYARMVRAQLSRSELIIFAFNGLRKGGRSQLNYILEGYRMLNALPKEDWVESFHRLYESTAFGSGRPRETTPDGDGR